MIARHMLHKKSIWLSPVLVVVFLGAFAILPGVTAGQVDGLKVGLIADSPNLMDGGFNEMAYTGLMNAKNDFGIEETVYLSTDEDPIDTNVAKCIADGNELCITVGYLSEAATYNAALANPTIMFAILDISYNDYPSNLQGMVFASEQAAYLAGTLAGKMTESNILGMIGGMDIPPVNVFLCGFEQGAIDTNTNITTHLTYIETFTDPDAGADAAQEMLDMGADVIFPVAGPAGSGALLTATQAGAWAVGVDNDQYLTVFDGGTVPGANHLLTSAMKRLDNAVYQIISETISGNFVSGTVVYDLAVEGVGLAPYHDADAFIPADAKAAVETARIGLLDGTIDPLRSCRTSEVYLPFLSLGIQPR
jgi:basic membrane protein A and related proteins